MGLAYPCARAASEGMPASGRINRFMAELTAVCQRPLAKPFSPAFLAPCCMSACSWVGTQFAYCISIAFVTKSCSSSQGGVTERGRAELSYSLTKPGADFLQLLLLLSMSPQFSGPHWSSKLAEGWQPGKQANASQTGKCVANIQALWDSLCSTCSCTSEQ